MLTRKAFGDFEIATLSTDKASISVVDYGANLNDFAFNGFQYIVGHSSAADLVAAPSRAGCAVLMPFANRIAGGVYAFEGKVYRLPHNDHGRPNALHGFLREVRWRFLAKDPADQKEERALRYAYDFPGVEGYPFPFHAEVEYELIPDGLRVSLSLKNSGVTPMPVTMGTHPFFRVDGPLSDWNLSLRSKGKLVRDENLIPTGEITQEDPSGKLDEKVYDDCFSFEGSITLSNSRGLRIEPHGFPYVQIYTHPDRKSIAIEPVTGAPNAFNNGMGLKVLKPGEELSAYYDVIPFQPRTGGTRTGAIPFPPLLWSNSLCFFPPTSFLRSVPASPFSSIAFNLRVANLRPRSLSEAIALDMTQSNCPINIDLTRRASIKFLRSHRRVTPASSSGLRSVQPASPRFSPSSLRCHATRVAALNPAFATIGSPQPRTRSQLTPGPMGSTQRCYRKRGPMPRIPTR